MSPGATPETYKDEKQSETSEDSPSIQKMIIRRKHNDDFSVQHNAGKLMGQNLHVSKTKHTQFAVQTFVCLVLSQWRGMIVLNNQEMIEYRFLIIYFQIIWK